MPEPDYDALAQASGGTAASVDYDALAAQHGGAAAPMNFAVVNGQRVPVNSPIEDLKRAFGVLPSLGGAIGGMVGGIPGAALGGAAGSGYSGLLEHAKELPGAVADVARNLVSEPVATVKGFMQGAQEGAAQAGISAAGQGAVQGAGQAIGAAVGPFLERAGQSVMQSALKPGLKASLAAMKKGMPVPPVVKTLLDEGVNVTPGGIEKLNGIIGATNTTIKDAIAGLPAEPGISPLSAAGRLSQSAAKFAQQVNPEADLRAISEAGQEFLSHPSITGPTMAPQLAQDLKTGTYAALKSKSYGELKGAAIEAQKAIARGLKEELANYASDYGVDLTAPNLREGAAIEARDAIARRVAMAGNRDPGGLAWLAHNPVTFLVFLAERSPAVKSMVARGLYQSAAKAAGVPANLIRGAVATIAASEDGGQ